MGRELSRFMPRANNESRPRLQGDGSDVTAAGGVCARGAESGVCPPPLSDRLPSTSANTKACAQVAAPRPGTAYPGNRLSPYTPSTHTRFARSPPQRLGETKT